MLKLELTFVSIFLTMKLNLRRACESWPNLIQFNLVLALRNSFVRTHHGCAHIQFRMKLAHNAAHSASTLWTVQIEAWIFRCKKNRRSNKLDICLGTPWNPVSLLPIALTKGQTPEHRATENDKMSRFHSQEFTCSKRKKIQALTLFKRNSRHHSNQISVGNSACEKIATNKLNEPAKMKTNAHQQS